MVKITIDPDQSGSHTERREGRLLEFPDGMRRIITLSVRKWLMYDELALRWVYPGLLEDDAFDFAHKYGAPGDEAFESTLSWLFGLGVEVGWAMLNEDQNGHANQNRPNTGV